MTDRIAELEAEIDALRGTVRKSTELMRRAKTMLRRLRQENRELRRERDEAREVRLLVCEGRN